MEYNIVEYTIKTLYDLVKNEKIDLNPSYQRNFIWSPINQRELIDTILRGYPLPALFLYQKDDKRYEMVDGQQRTKTIFRFITGAITASKKFGNASFKGINQESFLNYKIPVIEIKNLSADDSLKEFYVLINKKGVHVNTAESNKSEYHDTNFLKLANEVLTYQNLIDLNLFTETATKRMNDRAFIEELLGYLIIGVSKDKRRVVADLFESDISEQEYEVACSLFKAVIDKIQKCNEYYPIAKTRYKQKNDFYTLFCFLHESDDSFDVNLYQYKILLVLDGNDQENRQMIRPSNEECEALKAYAINCVTQSNSKSARESRLRFFKSMLENINLDENDDLNDVLNYLVEVFGQDKVEVKEVGPYILLNVDPLIS
ncbi:DUF262 domain-containing protein [Dyadobacter sp. CY261]|uniref:GmrSD restriction endonuclease domain-containing protein n=1 Tax=Dyadobacter sp. CY261 TaxID=2907203 RepID=UPI001F3234DB|nr:DUF262 domain-containing protein [Dyadobacter sp. CY261]MCF0075598.1 DUF262 domain-containing protein [Dyadobacter sp. CY261]